MIKHFLGAAGLSALICAAPANAAFVTATYSGVMTFTSAEATGAPRGYDAWSNDIVGDPIAGETVTDVELRHAWFTV